MDRLTRCGSFESCWKVYLGALNETGIQHAIYGYVLFWEDQSDLSGQFCYESNHQREYLELYEHEKCADKDTALGWGLVSDEVLEWGLEENLTLEQQKFDDLSREYGIDCGYTVPFRVDGGNRGGMGLSATGIQRKVFRRDIAPEIGYLAVITSLFHAVV